MAHNNVICIIIVKYFSNLYKNLFSFRVRMDIKKLNLVSKLFINGKWTKGLKGKSFDVINPAD